MPKAIKSVVKDFEFSMLSTVGQQRSHPWQEWLELSLPKINKKGEEIPNPQFLTGSINSRGEVVEDADYVVGPNHVSKPKTKANQFGYVLKLEAWRRGLEISTRVYQTPETKDDDGTVTGGGDIGIIYWCSVPSVERAEELKKIAAERKQSKKSAEENGDGAEENGSAE
jgi:hypothetical protein